MIDASGAVRLGYAIGESYGAGWGVVAQGTWIGVGCVTSAWVRDRTPAPGLTRIEIDEALTWLREKVRAEKKSGSEVPEGVIRLGIWLRDLADNARY